MPVTIELPHVGESVVEGTIGKWLKAARRVDCQVRTTGRGHHRQGHDGGPIPRIWVAAARPGRRGGDPANGGADRRGRDQRAGWVHSFSGARPTRQSIPTRGCELSPARRHNRLLAPRCGPSRPDRRWRGRSRSPGSSTGPASQFKRDGAPLPRRPPLGQRTWRGPFPRGGHRDGRQNHQGRPAQVHRGWSPTCGPNCRGNRAKTRRAPNPSGGKPRGRRRTRAVNPYSADDRRGHGQERYPDTPCLELRRGGCHRDSRSARSDQVRVRAAGKGSN